MRITLNFNENWMFRKDWQEAPSTLPSDWETVTLPHTWNAVDGQDGGNDYFRGTCCYAKTIAKAGDPGRCILCRCILKRQTPGPP